jgi:protein-tyrosine phosphatase
MTRLYWIEGRWTAKLGIAARPRGADWLPDEVTAWRAGGVDVILSLLTPDEEKELDLREEGSETKRQGMEFVSFPIADRQIPRSEVEATHLLEKIDAELSCGKNVLIHCRQGIGRSGLIAAGLLVGKGFSAGAALEAVGAARGVPVPETDGQRRWIERYAVTLAGTK